jgi:hypothetical protein
LFIYVVGLKVVSGYVLEDLYGSSWARFRGIFLRAMSPRLALDSTEGLLELKNALVS